MFALRAPSDDAVRSMLHARVDAAFPYAEVGATRDGLARAPAGYRLVRFDCTLGRGDLAFERARDRLISFAHYPDSFTRVVRDGERLAPGHLFATVATHFGFASIHPGRVIYLVDELDRGRWGFGFGTLPGHVLEGEERFLVTRDEVSGEVRYEVQSISRPGGLLARAARPFLHLFQDRFRRESCDAMRAID